MHFWKRRRDIASLLRGRLSEEMLDEPLLLDHVKTEDYLMVALEVRPCSLLTIPAEFKSGEELGRQIDELCAEDLQAVLNATADKKAVLISRLRKKIQGSFKKVVFASATYEAHINWARKLSLQTYDVEVRPSIHELYLFKDSKVRRDLRRLINLRNTARERLRLQIDTPKSKTRLAFPEEFSSEYLLSVGKLLGYPSCCVESYIHDRFREGNACIHAWGVEMRASRQVEHLRKEGEEPDVYAYFARNFFPCSPRCQGASEIGRKTFDLLSGLSPKLGDLYLKGMRDSLELVKEYPELTRQYREKLTKKAQKLSRT